MLKVLHVASFNGNIGDNANHNGFRGWFEGLCGRPVSWVEFEIRDVYRGERAFDLDFARYANQHDLVVVGGGNYFELWVESSPTGTSFSIDDEALAGLKVPVFFNAVGVDAGQGVPEQSRTLFRKFMSRILASDKFLVSVRNDGSLRTLKQTCSGLPVEQVVSLPDAGFFAAYGLDEAPRHQNRRPVVGINLAGDMLERRFPGGCRNNYEDFVQGFSRVVQRLDARYPSGRFILFPHIFRDLKVYADLLALLPDSIRRGNCRTEAYDVGDDFARDVFSTYWSCDLILGMRFHANVVAIGGGIPTIGLSCYDQIQLLYEELGRKDLAVDVTERNFEDGLMDQACLALDKPDEARLGTVAMRSRTQAARLDAAARVCAWLTRHGICV